MLDCQYLSAAQRTAALLIVACLAACSGLGEQRESPAGISTPGGEVLGSKQPDSSAGEATPRPAAPPRLDPAEGSARNTLLASAVQARTAGDSAGAIALLERAQRIDPDNAELYLELARTHLDAGNAAQARATAERGLLYCRREECAALRALIERAIRTPART